MPPKPKFTKEQIIKAALDLASESGIERLTARELGSKLGTSARPIFTVFSGMEELQSEVLAAAMSRFENFEVQGVDGMPLFKQAGVKMVLFGMQEPKLYQLLFMQENKNAMSFEDVFNKLGETAVKCVETIESAYSLSMEQAKTLFAHTWVYTFGVGALCSTRACVFSLEQISQMLTQDFTAMLTVLKNKE